MRLYFLDDEAWRHLYVNQKVKDVVNIHSVNAFIDDISKADLSGTATKATIISLDHDLGKLESDGGTGLEAARWLANSDISRSIGIVIHSWNIPGAKEMSRTLMDAGFRLVFQIPFDIRFYAGLDSWYGKEKEEQGPSGQS
jgi:hypothetical protein